MKIKTCIKGELRVFLDPVDVVRDQGVDSREEGRSAVHAKGHYTGQLVVYYSWSTGVALAGVGNPVSGAEHPFRYSNTREVVADFALPGAHHRGHASLEHLRYLTSSLSNPKFLNYYSN